MNEPQSSILFVGQPCPLLANVEIDHVLHLAKISNKPSIAKYAVICLNQCNELAELLVHFLDQTKKLNPTTQIIIIRSKEDLKALMRLINTGHVFKILTTTDTALIENTILAALEEFTLLNQNRKLLSLVSEQNEKLRALSLDLEEHVEKRQAFLLEEQAKLHMTKLREEYLHKCLVAIYQSASISEIEKNLEHILAQPLKIHWIKIVLNFRSHLQQSITKHEQHFALIKVVLHDNKREIGSIYFARLKDKVITKKDVEFFNQIGESVALALNRMASFDQMENLKQQWQATFDAITKPLCLTDSNWNIIRTNNAFLKQAGKAPQDIIGLNCNVALFDNDEESFLPRLGEVITTPLITTCGGKQFRYEIISYIIRSPYQKKPIHAVLYHDISDKERLEDQVIQSAKMAELGMIGSSIAHELNNPLGGILSFLHLLKNEPNMSDGFNADILAMEEAANKAKNIVHNLLEFARNPSGANEGLFDLREVLEKAIRITELQSFFANITVTFNHRADDYEIKGHPALMSQAFYNLFNWALNNIQAKQKIDRQYTGHITINLTSEPECYVIAVSDNGLDADPSQARQGYLIASQIIEEHGGSLALTINPGTMNRLAVRLPV